MMFNSITEGKRGYSSSKSPVCLGHAIYLYKYVQISARLQVWELPTFQINNLTMNTSLFLGLFVRFSAFSIFLPSLDGQYQISFKLS